MVRKKIKRNMIKCKTCGAIIESKFRNDFKFCVCKAVGVDGGRDYIRRCGNRENYIEMSEFEE